MAQDRGGGIGRVLWRITACVDGVGLCAGRRGRLVRLRTGGGARDGAPGCLQFSVGLAGAAWGGSGSAKLGNVLGRAALPGADAG